MEADSSRSLYDTSESNQEKRIRLRKSVRKIPKNKKTMASKEEQFKFQIPKSLGPPEVREGKAEIEPPKVIDPEVRGAEFEEITEAWLVHLESFYREELQLDEENLNKIYEMRKSYVEQVEQLEWPEYVDYDELMNLANKYKTNPGALSSINLEEEDENFEGLDVVAEVMRKWEKIRLDKSAVTFQILGLEGMKAVEQEKYFFSPIYREEYNFQSDAVPFGL